MTNRPKAIRILEFLKTPTKKDSPLLELEDIFLRDIEARRKKLDQSVYRRKVDKIS